MLISQVKWLQKGTLANNAWQNVSNIPRKTIDFWRLCRICFHYFVEWHAIIYFYVPILFKSLSADCMLSSLLRSTATILYWYFCFRNFTLFSVYLYFSRSFCSLLTLLFAVFIFLLKPNNWIVQGTLAAPLIHRHTNWTIPLMEFTYERTAYLIFSFWLSF